MLSQNSLAKANGLSKKLVVSALVVVIIVSMLMFTSCGNKTEVMAEMNEQSMQSATENVELNYIPVKLEDVYSGKSGVGDLLEEIESLASSSRDGYELKITGVDTLNFPQISIYYSLYNEFGTLITNTERNQIAIVEQMDLANTKEMQMISSVKPVKGNEQSNVSIVMDLSFSMQVNDNIDYLKEAVIQFVEGIEMNDQKQVSLIGFSEEIVSYIGFVDNQNIIIDEIESYETYGRTAFYNSLYWALAETNTQSGQKFIIAFTDGEDNRSRFSAYHIVNASKELGIPVHIIALGDNIDAENLRSIASESNGQYFNLSSISDVYSIYNDIFTNHMKESVVTYTTTNTDVDDFWRTLEIYYFAEDGVVTNYAQYNPVKSFIEDNRDTELSDFSDLDEDVVVDTVDFNQYVGIWNGYYYNNSGIMDMILEITEVTKEGNVSAVFNFTPSDKSKDIDRTGAFMMEGYIDQATNIVYLEGKDWITEVPKGYNTLDIYGEIFDNTFNGSFYRDYKPNFYLAKK